VHTTNCDNKTAGAFAYVGYHPNYNEIVASFRGSSDIPNWIEDVYAIKTPPGQAFPGIPNAQVEDGFYYYYMSLKSCVLAEIKNLKNQHSSYSIAITGHSLGAAGAAMCAMDMEANMGYSNVRLLNFGEPRLGNKAFSNAALQYIPNFQRMVDYMDCVPKLPPQALGYNHEAYEIYEHPTGADTYQICNNSGEDPSCSDSVGQNCDDHLHYMGVQCCDHP
jgi:predicted lipase